MIHALQYRRRSPMGNSEWRPQTWTTCQEVDQSLFDKGFDLAGVTEDLDRLANLPTGGSTAAIAGRCLTTALGIGSDLFAWHRWLLEHCSLAVEWPDPGAWSARPAQPRPVPYSVPVQYSKLRQAFLMMDFWALCIIQGILVLALRSRLPPDASLPESAALCTPERQLRLARNIACTLPYCWRKEHGVQSSARCIFSLRIALYVVRMAGTEEAKQLQAEIGGYMETIANNRGLKYANEIKRVSGGWGDTSGRTEKSHSVEGIYILRPSKVSDVEEGEVADNSETS